MGAADIESFLLRVDPIGFVYIVDTIREPYAAVAIERLDSIHSGAGSCDGHAFSCHLPARLIGNGLACLKSKAVIVAEFLDSPNVNHWFVPLSLSSSTLYTINPPVSIDYFIVHNFVTFQDFI